MNTLFPSTLLLAIAAGWFALPLIPTMVELRRRREAHPLAIDMENDGEVRHFARSFKRYLESNFLDPALREHVDSGSALSGSLSDGEPLQSSQRPMSHWRGRRSGGAMAECGPRISPRPSAGATATSVGVFGR